MVNEPLHCASSFFSLLDTCIAFDNVCSLRPMSFLCSVAKFSANWYVKTIRLPNVNLFPPLFIPPYGMGIVCRGKCSTNPVSGFRLGSRRVVKPCIGGATSTRRELLFQGFSANWHTAFADGSNFGAGIGSLPPQPPEARCLSAYHELSKTKKQFAAPNQCCCSPRQPSARSP
ncbi:hypothetical protein N431DRAFT_231870 [Stipitochalara longipes BDJ]|nr:hypothetical protein N431DRAFT_231870 [Stipitochalara longipes BDJ]